VIQRLLELIPIGHVVHVVLLVPHLAHEVLGQGDKVLLLLQTALQLAESTAPEEDIWRFLLLGILFVGHQPEPSWISAWEL